jgi:serpin B
MKHLAAVLVGFLLAACMPAAQPSGASGELVAAPREGSALFAELDRRVGREANVFYSPASVEQAFGLLHAGTAGETRTQLEGFFGWPAGEAADRELERRREALLAHGTDADIRLANALWLSDAFRFRQSYLTATRERYDATAETLDFSGNPAGSARRINGWAADRTNGLIDQIVTAEDLADDTAALLTNALYFEAEWLHMFDGFEMRPFLFGDAHEEPFRLMTQVEPFAVAEQNGWRAIRLPYRGGRFAMDVVMPEAREIMETAPTATVISSLAEALAGTKPRPVALELPRFEIDYDIGLVDPLSALGLTLPFDRNRADLSAMAEPGQQPLYVKDATHVTKLQVYEDGTKAAAVTTLRIVPTSMGMRHENPISFVVDRPFAVVIRDLQTGEVLFIGRIAAPQAFTPEKAGN